ncbi:MAG: peptidase M48 Ste24p [Anaerolineaceae bacterium]|nr:peptidase M48 Ste24p [Anaerolineaceae bacterium]
MNIRFSSNNARSRLSPRRSSGGAGCIRYVIAIVMAALALFSYLSSKQTNPVTGQDQYVSITQEQEIAIGLQSAPEMINQFDGEDPDPQAQQIVDMIGQELVQSSLANQGDYPFEFHLLADRETINAFALPGGQVFITRALFDRLQTEGQLAGVLAHEIVHVIARHGAERIAETQLTQGLTGAVVLATYDPNDPRTQQTAAVAAMIGQLVNMKFGRDDEIQSDSLGVKIMAQTGYDPRAMIEVMRILDEASAGNRPPEFFSTHPNPENRIAQIEAAIREVFPNGVPDNLRQ